MKPVKNAVTFFIHNEERSRFPSGPRLPDDEHHTGFWGLSTSFLEGGKGFENPPLRAGVANPAWSRGSWLVFRGNRDEDS